MSWFPDIDTDKFTADAQKAMQAPLGFSSPLWFAYAASASAGVAYWWMTQLTKPENLEAFSGMMEKYSLVPVPEMPVVEAPLMAAEPPAALEIVPPALVAEPVVEAAEAVADATEEVVGIVAPDPLVPQEAAEAATVALEPAEAPQAAAAVMEEAADDLTRLVGIGPSLATKLADLGVTTYRDIASWTEQDLEKYDKSLKLMGRAARENWVGQARQFAEQSTH